MTIALFGRIIENVKIFLTKSDGETADLFSQGIKRNKRRYWLCGCFVRKSLIPNYVLVLFSLVNSFVVSHQTLMLIRF